jgi:hypothetical protein
MLVLLDVHVARMPLKGLHPCTLPASGEQQLIRCKQGKCSTQFSEPDVLAAAGPAAAG